MAKDRFNWKPTRIPAKAQKALLSAKAIIDKSEHLDPKFKGDLMIEAMAALEDKYKRLEKQGNEQ